MAREEGQQPEPQAPAPWRTYPLAEQCFPVAGMSFFCIRQFEQDLLFLALAATSEPPVDPTLLTLVGKSASIASNRARRRIAYGCRTSHPVILAAPGGRR